MMEEKNMRKLWDLCKLIQDFCETHNNCNYCPFYVSFDECKIKHATNQRIDELFELFPENIMEDE